MKGEGNFRRGRIRGYRRTFLPIPLGLWGLTQPEMLFFRTDDAGRSYRVMNTLWNFIGVRTFSASPFLKK